MHILLAAVLGYPLQSEVVTVRLLLSEVAHCRRQFKRGHSELARLSTQVTEDEFLHLLVLTNVVVDFPKHRGWFRPLRRHPI